MTSHHFVQLSFAQEKDEQKRYPGLPKTRKISNLPILLYLPEKPDRQNVLPLFFSFFSPFRPLQKQHPLIVSFSPLNPRWPTLFFGVSAAKGRFPQQLPPFLLFWRPLPFAALSTFYTVSLKNNIASPVGPPPCIYMALYKTGKWDFSWLHESRTTLAEG